MSFGRRVVAPAGAPQAPSPRAEPRTRRGGYWLGLLANGLTSMVTLALMPFISQFKLNGASWLSLLVPGAIALLNVTAVAAVLFLLADLALRGLGWRRPWMYALGCLATVFAFYLAMTLTVGTFNPIFVLYVAVWPAAVGGWVIGLYRR